MYEAKAKFSEVIRRVKNGESVTVTERGKPTALISAIIEESETVEERLARLTAAGIITPATESFSFVKKGKKVKGGLERFLKDRQRE